MRITARVVRKAGHLAVVVQWQRLGHVWTLKVGSQDWVSGPVAAAIAGVSLMTVTNRRRAKTLTFRRRGKRFLYPVRELV